MKDVVILTETDLRSCVAVDAESIGAIEEAFRALATKPVAMPPILRLDLPEANGEVDVKTAYIPGLPTFAIKVSPGFFDNPKLGLPSLNGLMMVFSASTGLVEAILVDNGYLTAIRTAAAGAVAAKYLAPARVETIGVLGAGEQARLQVAAAMLARPASRILVWARNPDRAADCARDLAARLGIPAAVAGDPASLDRESQPVITATPSRTPLIAAGALHAGLHITAMGADAPEKMRSRRRQSRGRTNSSAIGSANRPRSASCTMR
jgi:ornithine cyclodeaminase/alanine dehydrogenase-like protein (mu-crystallin family)